ncbi:MAG: Bug family tripartite tricarboxylate transporter substrate binding protein [Beijerinckiaceae bacterium]
MATKRLLLAASICAVATSAAGLNPAHAQFYKGKTLNVVINYGAGGNTDVQGRTLMRYFEKYIDGSPRVVVRNMPGAGGAVGANFMNKGAKKDGTFMGVFTTPWMPELADSGVLTASLKDLIYIGAIGQQQIAHARTDIGGDGKTKSIDGFLKNAVVFKSAGHAPTTSKDIAIKVTLRMLGIKHEHVTGFKSAGPIRRAIMQNEIQYTEDSLAGYFGGVVPNLVAKGTSIPLWHNGVLGEDGLLHHAASVPKEIPTFTDVYKMKFGKDAMPKGLDWQLYKTIAGARTTLRTVVLPPGAPKEAVAALRAAWLKTVKDKDYLAEYKKKNNSELEWKTGEATEKQINEVLTVSPELRTHVQALAGIKKK